MTKQINSQSQNLVIGHFLVPKRMVKAFQNMIPNIINKIALALNYSTPQNQRRQQISGYELSKYNWHKTLGRKTVSLCHISSQDSVQCRVVQSWESKNPRWNVLAGILYKSV